MSTSTTTEVPSATETSTTSKTATEDQEIAEGAISMTDQQIATVTTVWQICSGHSPFN